VTLFFILTHTLIHFYNIIDALLDIFALFSSERETVFLVEVLSLEFQFSLYGARDRM
jgi:hypothetical protein